MKNQKNSENIKTKTVYVVIAEMERDGCIFGTYSSLEKANAAVDFIYSFESPFRYETIFTNNYFANYRKYKIKGEICGGYYSKYIVIGSNLSAYIIDTTNSETLIENFINEREFPSMLFLED